MSLEDVVRPEIANVAILMEFEMQEHASDKGESWKSMSLTDLVFVMQQELKEMYLAFETSNKLSFNYSSEIQSKIIDAMNLLMLVHTRLEERE